MIRLIPPRRAVIRRAGPEDAAAVAEVYLRSLRAALPTVTMAHTPDEVRGWVREVLVPSGNTWVVDDGRVVALLVLAAGWVEQLFVDPDCQAQGFGSALVDYAQGCSPDGLQLWTFQVNERARRFYERRGFVAEEFTDGAENEEREPDVRYRWRPE